MSRSIDALPGIAACVIVAIAARSIATSLSLGIETVLALVIGLAIGSVPFVRARLLPGAAIGARIALRAGVALLGVRLTLGQLLDGGAVALISATVIVLTGLALGALIARQVGIGPRLAALVAAGMAICGNSAIMALSPIVRAESRETTYAVSTITLFGLIAVLTFPFVGHLAAMSDPQFGLWAGLSVNDTAQVVATGFAFSSPAGDVATVVKLTRNLAIAPVVIGAALMVHDSTSTTSRGAIVRALPWFVVAFVLFAAARSLGWFDAIVSGSLTVADLLSMLAGILILVALAGVGMAADLRTTLAVGPKPFTMGLVLWVTIALLGFAIAIALGGSLGATNSL